MSLLICADHVFIGLNLNMQSLKHETSGIKH